MDYRKCFIPNCKNDSVNTPGKIIVRIREDLRGKWCREAEVEYYKGYTQYCCEDHFDPREDLRNYYQHKLMNEEPRLKATAVLRTSTRDINTDSTELVQQPTTQKLVKRKYDVTRTLNIPSTSPYSTLPIKTVAESESASTSQQPDLDILDPDEQSDSSLISDPEETSGAPEPSAPDVGLQSLSVILVCKACSKNITSFRYRCLVCPNNDMCGECERRGGHHDDHYVLRVPMQRPTLEVDQVESAVRQALSSSTTWNTAFKSTAKSGDTVTKPEITLYESGTTEPKVAGSDDEPEVKVELVIKEEVDPLEEEAAASAFLQNIHERQTTLGAEDIPSTQLVPPPSQGVTSYYLVPLIEGVPPSQNVTPSKSVQPSQNIPPPKGAQSLKGVPPSQGVPPSKRRRDDEHRFTTTTHSHKTTPTTNETTELCTDTSSSSTVATSSESGSKVDVFVLKKRTRPADENYD